MDVTSWLLRRTPPRPLLVAAPGGTAARLATERVVRERGWQPAAGPAEANLLVVSGPGEGAIEPYAERLWASMPAPRARANVVEPDDVARILDTALGELYDVTRQRALADHPPPAESGHTEHTERTGHTGHAEHAEVAHGGHDHHMGGMAMPGDIPMADRAADRDGLMLDQLHVPLGPALPLWPAGLIVHTRLQGDVIQEATVEVLGTSREAFWTGLTARRLDASARLLALAGWQDAAVTAQRLRDAALADALPADRLRKWTRRVGRSRTLRWLLAGVGPVSDGPPQLAGDAHTRLRGWLAGTGSLPGRRETQWAVDNLPSLLAGTELATARLVVASLDPDLDLLAPHEAHHG